LGEQSGDSVFLGLPSYSSQIDTSAAVTVFTGSSRKKKVVVSSLGYSLLAMTFNGLWCHALNTRNEHGLKWFAMLHSDVIPEQWWIDTLIEEAEAHDADVMSAVAPIKSPEGLTSTAIENPANPWEPLFRLTLKQVNAPTFPKTFDALDVHLRTSLFDYESNRTRLLVNTGCFVARIDKPWAEKIRFTIQDRIYKDDADGTFKCSVIPEDWQFSKDVASHGGKVMATTKVRLNHRGFADFRSDGDWGLARDTLCEKNGL
jgi:hypothetical protein